MASLKGDILEFQRQFLSSDPYSSSIEDNWSNFKSALSDAMIKHIPEKICKSTNHLPWPTHSIRKLINQRKHLYKQAKQLQTEEAWSKYRKLRNKITSGIRSAHWNYQNGLFTQDEGINHKNFWKYIKHIRIDQFGVAPLNVDDTCINNSKDKAESLNKQFQSVFTSENLLHMPNCNGLSSSTMPNITISVEGVQNLLESLDVAKAPGPDGIPTRILKLCAAEIAPILTVIYVQSLSSDQIPKDWLTANITPVFKKGDRGDPSNYRPISLTSVCCKILEHIIPRYIMEHLNANIILDTNQFGFRVGHSCEQQLISMIEEIQSAMDCRRQVDVIFLDFQKAFDTVPHQQLLKKLNHYGICGNIYNWLDIWLTQRKQRVVVSGYESNFVSVKSGVPQ